MVTSCITCFLLLQSVRATCTQNATSCKANTFFEAVSLVQRRAKQIDGKWQQKVHGDMHLLESPKSSVTQGNYDAIGTKISSLGDMLESQERKDLEEIRSQMAAHEQSLISQRAENQAAFDMNTVIEAKIKTTEDAIQGLRKEASTIMKENQALSTTLETLTHNISIAQEFALESLKVSKKVLQAAPELQVLKDLEAKDADNEHQKRLENFAGGASRLHLSMMHMVQSGPDAHELLARLDSHLSEASAEKKASLAKLSESFSQLWKEGESRHEELIKHQQHLNETLHSAEIIREKVTAAVQHLTTTKNQLSEHVKALRAFGQSLGSEVKTIVPIATKKTATSETVKTIKPMSQNETGRTETVTTIVPMANNEKATSSNSQQLSKSRYVLHGLGADGCPDGLEIKTLAECEQAVGALALATQPVWNHQHAFIPQWCSYKQNGQCEKSQCMHFNAGAVGKGRKDLAPICRSS